jgi:two-component system chemotaxis sensor kinase CheA
VRDLSKELNKEIDFITEGVETELDKSIIEKISDPILHILRNCVDHGIESQEERLKKGKKKSGTLVMKAFHSGTGVNIQIKDDGGGIDPEKVRVKAISKGMIAEGATLSKEEAINLLFSPGFSTAEKITDVSGRGVGMDIVRRNIESIHGEVTIESTLHEGTTISIKLPLTLSIIDGMLVKIGSSDYILPLSSVDKCFEIKTENLSSQLTQKVALDGTLLPVFNLREAFHEQDEKPQHTQIIKIHYDEFPVCITVDSVIGEYQAVMKPLTGVYRSRDDFSGATILGDGSVALVMDTTKLIRSLAIQTPASFH